MEHNQTRWYEVLKIMIGNWVEWYDIVGTTKEVPTDFLSDMNFSSRKIRSVLSKILNLREGSYSHAKLSLYTVYEYVYLQVQAIPHD